MNAGARRILYSDWMWTRDPILVAEAQAEVPRHWCPRTVVAVRPGELPYTLVALADDSSVFWYPHRHLRAIEESARSLVEALGEMETETVLKVANSYFRTAGMRLLEVGQ